MSALARPCRFVINWKLDWVTCFLLYQHVQKSKTFFSFLLQREVYCLVCTAEFSNSYAPYINRVAAGITLTTYLCISESPTDMGMILGEFNGAHQAINFTFEQESGEGFVLVDVLVKRSAGGSVWLTVYRKSTWTDWCTQFLSFTPLCCKRNLILDLATRAQKICSEDTVDAEL